MAGLGKYCTGGYGRIGVYRVNSASNGSFFFNSLTCTRPLELLLTGKVYYLIPPKGPGSNGLMANSTG